MTNLSRRALLGTAAAASSVPLICARAAGPSLKIGVLTDMSGPYQDNSGAGAVIAAKLAVEKFGAAAKGMKVEVIGADHQNKPDLAASIARQWFDRDGVDVVSELSNSAVALAVDNVAKEKNKVSLVTGAASSDITGKACNANTIHWVYDTWMLGKSTGGALVKAGGNTWFFITADYAFGHALQNDTSGFITAAGGKILGSVAYPFPATTDFSSFLLQAQSSGAKVVGLANAGADTQNSIKQAKEFGLKQTLAGLLLFITDVHALGLKTAEGLAVTASYYWDMNDGTRAFADRFFKAKPGWRPSMVQAGMYSSVLHYLKAVEAMGGAAKAKVSGAAAVAKMKSIPTDDECFGKGVIRIDGRKIHPSYLFKVKSPAESKKPWDYYKLVTTTPADQAFRPLKDGHCSLVGA